MSIPRSRARTTTVPAFVRGTNYISEQRTCAIVPYTKVLFYTMSNPYTRAVESCQDWLNPGPPYKEGHEFFLKRKSLDIIESDSVDVTNGANRYVGSFYVMGSLTEVDSTYAAYSPTAGTYGATCWKRFRPTKPGVNAGQWLAELRDFPTMLKTKIRIFKDLGSQYLNYQFGWRPFVNDIVKFIKTQRDIENRIAYIRKNNDKWVRRHGILQNNVTVSQTDVSYRMSPSLSTYFYPLGIPLEKARRLQISADKIWFDAVWKFYIRGLEVDSCSSVWSSKLLRKLYGFEITPSLCWELIPFTWLQDWIVNIGDIIDNFTMSMYDNLVAKYAYVMRHRSLTVKYEQSQTLVKREPLCPSTDWTPYTYACSPHATTVITAECKERARASQWGFGEEGSSLTPSQLAILYALGISAS